MSVPRILTFLHSFEPGGVERVALRLVRTWQAAGLGAELFVGRTDGALRGELAADLELVTPPPPPFSIARVETLWMMLTLPRHIRRARPDLLFCAGNSYTVVALAMKLLLGRRCPPVVAKISNDLKRRDLPPPLRLFYLLWLRIQGRFLDRIVALAEPMVAEIVDLMGVERWRVAVIPDAALTDAQIASLAAAPMADKVAHRRFVTIARLAPQKDLPLMLRAFARGAAREDRLTIYGDGPERAALERLVRKLGLMDRVILEGHRADGAALLNQHDIFLLSSAYEGVPAALLEALAAGLTVIVTDCCASMGALLDHGRLGQLVPVGDTPALATAIRDARAGNQDRATARAQAARFTVEHAAASYATLFRQLAACPAAAAAPAHCYLFPEEAR